MSADVVRLPTLHERRQKRLRFALIDTWAEFRTEGYSADEIAEALEAQAKLLRQCAEHWRQIDRALALDGVPEEKAPKAGPGRGHKAPELKAEDGPLFTSDRGEKTTRHDGGAFSEREIQRLRAINRAPEADGGES